MMVCSMTVAPRKSFDILALYKSDYYYYYYYDPIQGQRQGHEPLKVGNSAIFKGYLLPMYNGGCQMTMDS